jgi:hypothetical protein
VYSHLSATGTQHLTRTAAPVRQRVATILFLAALCTYAQFQQAIIDPNVASRLFLDYSIITRGTVAIDSFAPLTIDKATVGGHFYSDKAPGESLLALPVLFVLWRPLMAGHPGAPDTPTGSRVPWPAGYFRVAYVGTLATSTFVTALSVAALFLLAASLFESNGAAILVAASYGFATPAVGWATAFVGHAAAMALLTLGLTALHFAAEPRLTTRQAAVRVVVGVACLTWATVTEFTAGPVAAAIAVYAAPRILVAQTRRATLIVAAVGTAAVFVAPLFVYDTIAFGAPWHLGYQSVQGFAGMRQGLLGIGRPDVHVLAEITVGAHRGLLRLSPVLVLVPAGLVLMLRRTGSVRAMGALCGLVILYYLLVNSGYYYWDGGWSTGPRHITAMLAFAALPLGAIWTRAAKPARISVVLLAVVSAGLALLCASSGMFAPARIVDEVRDFVIRNASEGYSTAFLVRHSPVAVSVFLLLLATALGGVWLLLARELSLKQARPPRQSQGLLPEDVSA